MADESSSVLRDSKMKFAVVAARAAIKKAKHASLINYPDLNMPVRIKQGTNHAKEIQKS